MPCVTASIKKPIHNVKDAGRSRVPPAKPAEVRVFISGVFCLPISTPDQQADPCLHSRPGGAYRDRTDDLKLAKLALSQLS